MRASDLTAYLDDCRRLAVEEIRAIVPRSGRCAPVLYDLMFEYPLRHAKALRPALCIATCRALGGRIESVLRSAAVLELYHNAFLIHDDVEDGSEKRRDGATLHRMHGVPIAVNVGDAMLALTLEPLLDNMRTLGIGKALRILQVIAHMARQSAEGQALELSWIRDGRWDLTESDYVRMVYKKTSWYTFITPMVIGAMVANTEGPRLVTLRKFASLLGIAFQMQDDILNLTAERARYGKEKDGDLWEGKHTLMLLHVMRSASRSERATAQEILRKPRPTNDTPRGVRRRNSGGYTAVSHLLSDLQRRGDLTRSGAQTIRAALRAPLPHADAGAKTRQEITFLLRLIDRYGSTPYAREVAQRWASRASKVLAEITAWMEPSVHRDFIAGLVDFVVRRDH